MKKKNQQIAKISVFITSLFVIFLSVTYAFINLTIGGEKRQVITAGSLELELIEDENNLMITNALPMYDEVGMIQDAFTFRLQNKGIDSVGYTIKLVDITTGDKLNVNDVRYGLVKDSEKVIKSLASLNEGIIDEGKIDADIKIEYALRLWIREDLEDNELIRDKELSFRIDIEGGQEIEISYAGMINPDRIFSFSDTYGPTCSNSTYCWYVLDIKAIVFENQISIPEGIDSDKIWDLSVLNDGTVMGYLERIGSAGYKFHIQANGKIYANPDSSSMFAYYNYLESIEGLEYFDTSNVTDMSSMFYRCYSLTSLDLTGFDTSKVKNMAFMFQECSSLTGLDLSNFDTSNVTNMAGIFSVCRSFSTLDLTGLNTSKVTNMAGMFSRCSSLTSLDLSNFDTSNVTNMADIFSDCRSFSTLDLTGLNTSKVIDMSGMFSGCSGLTNLDLTVIDTSNVTNMRSMFSGCSSFSTLDLTGLNTSKVIDMSGMFSGCSGLTNLDLTVIDTSNVTNMAEMFGECSSFVTLDLTGLNTSKVKDMSYMFRECSSLTSLDLTVIDTSNVTDVSYMFDGDSSLNLLNLSNMSFDRVSDSAYFLRNVKNTCTILVKDQAAYDFIMKAKANFTNVSIFTV